MHITITGASGFVGSNLCQYLVDKQYSIHKLSLKQEWKSKFNNNTQVVIHLAGKAHDLENVSDESEYFKVNRDLTIELFDVFLKSQATDFFYFSSVKAVADTVDDVLTEDACPNPLTPYGKSKLEAENYLLNQNLPHNKRLFIIRPCMIHGLGNKGNLNLLFKIVEKNIPWPLASFNNKRSFLSIDNLNFLIEAMLEKEQVSSGIYNFSDDIPLATNDLIKIMDPNALLLPIPKKIIYTLAKLGDWCKLPLNSERLKKLTENYVVSNNKIKMELEINSLPLSAAEGIAKTIEGFKKRK